MAPRAPWKNVTDTRPKANEGDGDCGGGDVDDDDDDEDDDYHHHHHDTRTREGLEHDGGGERTS